MRRLVVASGNAHKVTELRQMLGDAELGLEVVGLRDIDGAAPEVEETETTFVGNARLKADGFATWLAAIGEPGATVVLADDSGISIDAFGGEPGVYSARFAGPGATDADNNAKMVRELEARRLRESPAHYSCVLVLRRVDGKPLAGGARHLDVEAQWPVTVRVDARGDGGFGYDPYAWLPDGRSVAELPPEEKSRQSHRGKALRRLVERWSEL